MKKWKIITIALLVIGIISLPIISFAANGDTYTNKSGFWDYYEIEEIFNDGPVKEEDLISVLQDEGYNDNEIEIMLKEGAERESKVANTEESKEQDTSTEESEEQDASTEESEEQNNNESSTNSFTATLIFAALFILFFICYFAV